MSNKTISGRTITATPNYKKRTFTIRTESGKYRTLPMTKQDFNSSLYDTANDWQQFLRYDNGYYTVK